MALVPIRAFANLRLADTLIQTRQLEAFGRKVTATAGHLLGDADVSQHYHSISRELRRPVLQRSVFSFAQTSPRDLIRSNVSVSEIQHRALSSLPDEILAHIPENQSTYSLFQGFQATLPEDDQKNHHNHHRHGRRQSRGRKLLTEAEEGQKGPPPALMELRNEKWSLNHRLEMLGIRKSMCATEIRDIDTKIANFNTMRKIVLERLAGLEQEEMELEQDLVGLDNRLEDLEEELEDAAILARESEQEAPSTPTNTGGQDDEGAEEFMSQSIYQKIPSTQSSPKSARRKRPARRISMPILHEHLEPGSRIREVQAHNDMITALDFDSPFGSMVTAAMDDTVRVWDLNAGRCMGMLEGHLSSVRCLQVEENIVATGSMDASIRLWDLSKAEYDPQDGGYIGTTNGLGGQSKDDDDGLAYEGNPEDAPPAPHASSMQDCPLFTLEAHVAEVTALNFRGDTLVSGSADKTLRQWDLQKGRCVQTLDVLWAAAQASSTFDSSSGTSGWGKMGRFLDAEADFVGALQVFDAALACGTADGMVRLWDLRSGQVHRSLVGHTGPVTALQFDDVHLVTGSLDRSIRVGCDFLVWLG